MGNRIGLVLEGGAMRGMFTCGVIDVLMENDIWFEAAAGISAGAVFGCNYKSRQIGRPIRYNKTYCKDPRYCSYRSLIKTGDLYGSDKLADADTERVKNILGKIVSEGRIVQASSDNTLFKKIKE